MSTRYLYKDKETPRYVHIWTPQLAARRDMIECDAKGKKISAAVEQASPKHVDIPLIGVVDAPPFVPADEGQLPDIADAVTDAGAEIPVRGLMVPADEGGQPASAESEAAFQERVLEIQARLSALSGPDIRRVIKQDFNGAKAPAGISKLQLVEAYIQFDNASRA